MPIPYFSGVFSACNTTGNVFELQLLLKEYGKDQRE